MKRSVMARCEINHVGVSRTGRSHRVRFPRDTAVYCGEMSHVRRLGARRRG